MELFDVAPHTVCKVARNVSIRVYRKVLLKYACVEYSILRV